MNAVDETTIPLALERVSKSFGSRVAVDQVTLRVHAAETVVLIGPSGCGKSTILRLMLGLERPDRGEVRFQGRPVDGASLRESRRRIGYVIQDGGLFPHMTARANATLMARQLRWTAPRTRARLEELVQLTAFPGDGLDRHPDELSGGQRQRVALMRALFLDPEVLLLDEPLGSLDPMVRFDLQHDLREIFRRLAKTTVLVTHDLAEAIHFGQRLVLLREGRIAAEGTAAELAARPADAFVTRFLAAQRSIP
jgi:osmoprotectant transport system ATP-binding protein